MEIEKTIEELRVEADGLGIKYHPKTGATKLAEKIEEFYVAQESADIVKEAPIEDEDEDEYIEETVEEQPVLSPKATPKVEKAKVLNPKQQLLLTIAEMKKKALKKRIVTVSSNDKRDSEYTTTAYLSVSNQYMDIAKLVPLDIPVELEQCLISVAKTATITLHKDEIRDGRRTGNKVAVSVRKYNVSYEDMSE